jgi:hypothetical protein
MKFIHKKQVVFLLLFSIFSLRSQTLKWSFGAGDPFGNETKGVTSDSKGNLYITGQFVTNINLNPGNSGSRLTGSGFLSIFVGKFDPEGKHTWSAGISNNSVCRIFDIAMDNNDNFYLAGTFIGEVNFKLTSSINTRIRSTGIGADGFMAKYDSDGKLIWVKQIESKGNLAMKTMSVTSDGKVYLGGEFRDTTDFDPSAAKFTLASPSTTSRVDIFIAQYDQNGNFVRVNKLGGAGNDNIKDIVTGSDGKVYITGIFEETVDFDPSVTVKNLTASGQEDIFLAAYDKTGKYLWANKIGGIGNEAGKALVIDDKKLYLAGDFEGLIDLALSQNNPLMTSAGGTDIFLAQYDAVTGNLAWGQQAGGPGNDICGSLVYDLKQNLYVSGNYENEASFDGKNKLLSAGESDIFIAAYSTSGIFRQVIRTGGKGIDENNCLHADNNRHLFAGGSFSDTVDFNPSPNINLLKSTGEEDMFIAVYDLVCDPPPAPKTDKDKVSLCFKSSGTVTAEGKGSISWHSASEGGALIGKGKSFKTPSLSAGLSIFAQDSTCEAGTRKEVVIEVDQAIDTGIILSGNTLTARQTGASYLWLDCNNNRKPIDGADKRTFTPVINGNYAVVITVNNCSSLSACVNINSLDISGITPDLWEVYPNPASDILHINHPGSYSIKIYTTDGRLLEEQNATGSANINLSVYPAGLYILQMDNGTVIKTQKIITE